jgi:hypothetical protein
MGTAKRASRSGWELAHRLTGSLGLARTPTPAGGLRGGRWASAKPTFLTPPAPFHDRLRKNNRGLLAVQTTLAPRKKPEAATGMIKAGPLRACWPDQSFLYSPTDAKPGPPVITPALPSGDS